LVAECRSLLLYVSLQNHVPNVWKGHPNLGEGYIVSGVYQMLTRKDMHIINAVSERICYTNVPLNVSICA